MGGDPSDSEQLPIDPALLKLPAGDASTGDPVDGNPFPAGTARHDMWARATRIAEEKIARIKADWLQSQQHLGEPKTIEEVEEFNTTYRTKHRELLGKEFDVWAGRAAQVVYTDNDVRHMDGWLVGYAEAFLDGNACLMLKHGLPRHLIENELRWMRDSLAAHVLHWRAENREEAREANEARTDSAPSQGSSGEHPLSAREARSNASFPNRAAWFREELDKRGWSVQDLEAHNGPNWKTGRRILEGRSVKETVLGKVARAFSEKARVTRMDIPDD